MSSRFEWLTVGAFLVWCLVSQRWYVCHIKDACGAADAIAQTPSAPATPDLDVTAAAPAVELSPTSKIDVITPEVEIVDDRPLVFRPGDAQVQVQDRFPQFKQATLGELQAGQMLEIVGLHYPGEPAPEGFANMGLARAAQVRALFAPPLPADRVVTTSRLVDETPDGDATSGLIEALAFDVRPIPKPDAVEIIATVDTVTILYPSASAIREADPQIDVALSELAEHMSQTDQVLFITGHTDNTGSAERNHTLGLQRASGIRDQLVGKGLDSSRIRVQSQGQTKPVADNDTDEGRRRNRRVEMRLVENF